MGAGAFTNNIHPRAQEGSHAHLQQTTAVIIRDRDLVGWLHDTTQYQMTRPGIRATEDLEDDHEDKVAAAPSQAQHDNRTPVEDKELNIKTRSYFRRAGQPAR
jgi:hypothetical protein